MLSRPRRQAPARAPLSPEERAALAREMVSTIPGLRGRDLKKKLPKPLQSQHAELLETLRELAATGGLFRYVTARDERFFSADPLATLDRVVPEILARNGPLDATAIRRALATSAPGHEEPFAEWLKRAPARRLIFEHASAPKARAKRYGHTPDLRRLLAKVLVELRKAVPTIDAHGVPREQIADTLLGDLGLPIRSEGSPAASDRDVLEAALAALAANDRPGTLLLVKDLRARTPLDKARFDRAALSLAEAGRAVLHHHDSPAALPERERDHLIADGRGTFYVGVAPRRAP